MTETGQLLCFMTIEQAQESLLSHFGSCHVEVVWKINVDHLYEWAEGKRNERPDLEELMHLFGLLVDFYSGRPNPSLNEVEYPTVSRLNLALFLRERWATVQEAKKKRAESFIRDLIVEKPDPHEIENILNDPALKRELIWSIHQFGRLLLIAEPPLSGK